MKACKYCYQEIPAPATKCFHCQSLQNWWLHPSLIILGIFLILWFSLRYTFRVDKYEFKDYQEQIKVEVIRVDTVTFQSDRYLNLVLNLKNNTDIRWSNGEYEILLLDANQKIVNAINEAEFALTLQPQSVVHSSIRVPYYDYYGEVTPSVKFTSLWHRNY